MINAVTPRIAVVHSIPKDMPASSYDAEKGNTFTFHSNTDAEDCPSTMKTTFYRHYLVLNTVVITKDDIVLMKFFMGNNYITLSASTEMHKV